MDRYCFFLLLDLLNQNNNIMKNNKLKLEKFRIAKLDNYKSIFGGGSNECVDDGTKDIPPKLRCIKTSKEWEPIK